ncbi:hypothetical protein L484_002282 [Morus notabilis]|uniref:Uncharacterized protein n=1 Tax=Morus notabilis TaxID=981085 RepID=W9RUR4_9ROSA|nr:hypothetical protein L484_002282 [Morus notabilis]
MNFGSQAHSKPTGCAGCMPAPRGVPADSTAARVERPHNIQPRPGASEESQPMQVVRPRNHIALPCEFLCANPILTRFVDLLIKKSPL